MRNVEASGLLHGGRYCGFGLGAVADVGCDGECAATRGSIRSGSCVSSEWVLVGVTSKCPEATGSGITASLRKSTTGGCASARAVAGGGADRDAAGQFADSPHERSPKFVVTVVECVVEVHR
jgi:hypothetical protein